MGNLEILGHTLVLNLEIGRRCYYIGLRIVSRIEWTMDLGNCQMHLINMTLKW